MGNTEIYIQKIAEDAAKEGHSLVKATLNTFFKVYGGDLILSAKDNYYNERFKWRLEDFAFEEYRLNDDDIRNFYENINHQQLNYLFELFEKARISTFDLHAKILSKLYANLLKNGDLSYYESTLLVNIMTLNEDDFKYLYNAIKGKSINDSDLIETNNDDEFIALRKFIMLGILSVGKSTESATNKCEHSIYIGLNNFSLLIKTILDDIL